VRFVDLDYRFLTDRRLDVEYGEDTRDIEEQASEGEVPPWAYPGNGKKVVSKNGI
jgi:hypothetical protein